MTATLSGLRHSAPQGVHIMPQHVSFVTWSVAIS